MRLKPREDLVTTAGWSDLVEEFDQWGEGGRAATLWWRDDDAVAASCRLDRLVSIADDVPISLAVVPATVDRQLAAWITYSSRSRQAARLSVLQHGWCHTSRAIDGKKNEFPAERSCHAVRSELTAGRSLLTDFFGARALPVLAPPWNRFAPRFLPLLATCGLRAISLIKPRRTCWPAAGVTEVNVHIDLVTWAGDRGFIGEEAALAGIVGHLRARRYSEVDSEEPTGILTHHLVQNGTTDAFLCRLVAITKEHPAARWLDPVEVFADAL